MSEESSSAPKRPGIFRRKQKLAYEPWEELQRRETAIGLAALKQHQMEELAERRLRFVLSLWPIGVGICLSLISPYLKHIADANGPWFTVFLFPFVVLADRPELKVGPITHSLAVIMLYAQFPIEGLLARVILRRPVLPLSVAMQVVLFHFLGIVEVWMLNGMRTPVLHP